MYVSGSNWSAGSNMQFYKYEYAWGRDIQMRAHVGNECGLLGECVWGVDVGIRDWTDVFCGRCVIVCMFGGLDLLYNKHVWMEPIFIFTEDAHDSRISRLHYGKYSATSNNTFIVSKIFTRHITDCLWGGVWGVSCGLTSDRYPTLIIDTLYIDGLVQEICNSIANALELHLSRTNPLVCNIMLQQILVSRYFNVYCKPWWQWQHNCPKSSSPWWIHTQIVWHTPQLSGQDSATKVWTNLKKVNIKSKQVT